MVFVFFPLLLSFLPLGPFFRLKTPFFFDSTVFFQLTEEGKTVMEKGTLVFGFIRRSNSHWNDRAQAASVALCRLQVQILKALIELHETWQLGGIFFVDADTDSQLRPWITILLAATIIQLL